MGVLAFLQHHHRKSMITRDQGRNKRRDIQNKRKTIECPGCDVEIQMCRVCWGNAPLYFYYVIVQ